MKNNCFLIWAFLLMICLAGGCTISKNEQEATEELCRYIWEDSFITTEGIECDQLLVFNEDNTGIDTYYFYYPYRTEIFEYYFNWVWDSEYYYHTVILDYGEGDYLYFEDIDVDKNILTGTFDDSHVIFTGRKK